MTVFLSSQRSDNLGKGVNLYRCKRIAIIGIGGAGKSTLSRKIAGLTGLPLFHIDAMRDWKGYWEPTPTAEFLYEHSCIVSAKEWIIEGFIERETENRLAAADIILFLDYSGIVCAWRVLRRWLRYRNKSRPDLCPLARVTLDLYFLMKVLKRTQRVDIENILKDVDQGKVIRFHSPRQLKYLIAPQLNSSTNIKTL